MVQYRKGVDHILNLAIALYILYMSVNIYTDSKYMETYNRWHLIFLVTFSCIYIYLGGGWFDLIATILSTLIMGLIFENIKAVQIGAGDTKMLIVSAIFLLLTTNLKIVFIAIFAILLMKVYLLIFTVTFVAFALLYYKYVKQENIGEGSFRYLTYKITITKMANEKFPKVNLSVPATGGILLSTMTLLFIF